MGRNDKARFGRVVNLTPVAVLLLDAQIERNGEDGVFDAEIWNGLIWDDGPGAGERV